jgi:D-glycero-alpha-D-manno-heptose-7-phosphate kinase
MRTPEQLSTQHSAPSTRIVARAPLRISFGGGGTDLAAYYERQGGLVVSAAIRRYCTVAVGDSVDGGTRIISADYGLAEAYGPGELPVVAEPLILPKAVLEWFVLRGYLPPGGVTLSLSSEVPPGTGLGSSSAMAVALIRALAARAGLVLDPAAVADLACWIEIERLGMPIGKQDQYASAFGGLNRIAFRAAGVTIRPLVLDPATYAALENRLLLFSTGRGRNSATVLGRQRAKSASDSGTIARLGRLKLLADEMHEALLARDLDAVGRLLDVAWREKRGLTRGVSSAAIDRWYDTARAAGALGGKITGAGGGGFLLLFCPPGMTQAVRAAMTRCGLRELPFAFDLRGARVAQEVVSTEWSPFDMPPAGVATTDYRELADS